jgi:hypothetical protein
MKRIICLLFILSVVAGCSKSDAPIHRKMAAAAYYYQDGDAGRFFSFYLVENKSNLIQNPDDPNAMKAANYVMIDVCSEAETPQGSYSLIDPYQQEMTGEAHAYDNCRQKERGSIISGTVEIGDNTIAISGTMDNGKEYSLSYSGPFQQTGFITTFVKAL